MAEKKQVHVIVRGRVQGVCFRMETQRAARDLNLTGWVRNRADGSVEATFEGEKSDLDQMIQWCRQGPPASSVDRVETDWPDTASGFTGFDIRF
ncbi:MAG: acylphosphatase [Desulfobacteraceae bacterium]|nr:acylphosphatase [Desulfobacteraceae bacterium]